MKPALAAFLSLVLSIAIGLLAAFAMPSGGSSRLGGVLLMVGFAAVPLVAGGFAYRRWFYRTTSSCLAGVGAYCALAAVVAVGVPDSFPMEVLILLLTVTLTPWYAGFLAGKHLGTRAASGTAS